MSIPSDPVIFQLKAVLAGISPMIWRRLLIHSDTTIAELHYILQICFAWSDDHRFSNRFWQAAPTEPTVISLPLPNTLNPELQSTCSTSVRKNIPRIPLPSN